MSSESGATLSREDAESQTTIWNMSESEQTSRSEGDGGSGSLQKAHEYWIEKVFKRRECVKPIVARGDMRCGCGRLLIDHRYALQSDGTIEATRAGTQDETRASRKWHPPGNTCTLPTDAFGQIEFQGDAHPNKAQYVRLDYMTPPEHVLELLLNHWKLQLPRLLISVHGGIANFDLQPKLKRVFRKGLIRAAHTTGAWIITGGTTTGVMKHVGEALSERTAKSNRRKNIVAIGVAPWGVVSERGDLIARDACVEYHAAAYPKSNMAVLNTSHNYFLLADNGTHGKYGAEIMLRKHLEHYVSQQKISTRGEKPLKGVPIVCMVLEGGSNIIRTVLDYVTDTPAVPVVVCDGSGRASDLLAFAHKYSDENGQLPEALKEQLISTIQKTFAYSLEQASSLYDELMLCMKKKEMIAIFRLGESVQDIDLAILTALLKTQNMGAPQQLSLALAWDRVDLARSHVFTYGQEWPEGSLEQAMMDALMHDRVDFVQLLLDKGVNMSHFLTVGRLEELYNTKVGPTTTLYMMLQDVRKTKVLGTRVTLLEVGLIMNALMGGAYRSSYSRRKFKNAYHEIMKLACTTFPFLPLYESRQARHTFEYPFSELMVWAVLLKRQAMAKFMWRHEEEALAKAIVASKLYKSLHKEALKDVLVDNVIAVELMKHSSEFQKLALEFLDYVYKQDDDMAQQLLTYELKNWSGQTCLSLAYSCGMRDFIAHTCCQNLITEMWMGGLRMNKNHNLKVLGAIILPVLIPLLGYKSQSELQLMPQTVEEHIQDLERTRCSAQGGVGEDGTVERNSASASDSASEVCPAEIDGQTPRVENGEAYDETDAANVVTWQPVSAMTPNASAPVVSVERIVTRNSFCHSAVTKANRPAAIFRKNNKRELRLSTKIYEFYSAPVTKFWLHTIAYFFFLGTLSYTVLVRLDRETVYWPEGYTMAYIFFQAVEMFREIAIAEPPRLSQKVKVFFQEKWNIIDAVAVIVFWIGVVLRFQSDETVFLWGHVLYSLDTICWYVRIFELFQVSRQLGPFVVIIEKLVNNIINLLAFFCVVIWAFGVPRQAILNPYAEPEWTIAKDVMMEPYFMFFGELFADKINPPCGNGTDVVCWPGRWIVPILMSIYLLSSYVLLMNLLIAVFNYTFMKLNANSMEIWMYQRYGLMLEYEIKPLLPPPFVVLSHFYLATKWLHRRLRRKPGIKDFGLKLFLNDVDIRKLHDFEEDCLGDFFLNMEIKLESSADERIRVTSEKVDTVLAKVDDISQKQGQLATAFTTLDLRNSSLESIAIQTNAMLSQIQEALLQPAASVKQKHTVASLATDSEQLSRSTSLDDSSDGANNTLGLRRAVRNSRRPSHKPQPFAGDEAISSQIGAIAALPPQQPSSATDGQPLASSIGSGPVQFTIGDDHASHTPADALSSEPSHHSSTGAAASAELAQESPNTAAAVGGGCEGVCPACSLPLCLELRHVMPAVPVVPQQEYTSITDTIDTSCLLSSSPVHSPVLGRRPSSGVAGLPHVPLVTEAPRCDVPDQENLHLVEESATKVIGGSLKLRIRGLSLNDSSDSLIDEDSSKVEIVQY